MKRAVKFAGQCECKEVLVFELPPGLYPVELPVSADLGACTGCGRRYVLGISIIRGFNEPLVHDP